MKTLFKNVVRIVSGVLNELSDQSAYRRHLIWHGTVHSAQEWRKFQDRHWQRKTKRGRCC